MNDPQALLAAEWKHLADQCVEIVRTHQDLITQLSRAGLLTSPTATALTARVDQLEAEAAEIRRLSGYRERRLVGEQDRTRRSPLGRRPRQE